MKVLIIIGSTRPGRVSERLAKWVAAEAKNMDGTEIELVDLLDYQLPMLDEPMSPQYNPDRKPNEQAQKWLAKVAEGDAYVIVTPEYNRSYPAALKNALDYIDFQMEKKPVALVAHGSSGGAQAVSHLRGVLPGLKAITTPSATYFVGRVGELVNEDGALNDDLRSNPYGPQSALKATLNELKWYGNALATARH